MDDLKAAAKVLSTMFLEEKWNMVEILLRAYPDRQRTQIVLYIMCVLNTAKSVEFAEWYASNV